MNVPSGCERCDSDRDHSEENVVCDPCWRRLQEQLENGAQARDQLRRLIHLLSTAWPEDRIQIDLDDDGRAFILDRNGTRIQAIDDVLEPTQAVLDDWKTVGRDI